MKLQKTFLSTIQFIATLSLFFTSAVFAQSATMAINPVLTAVGRDTSTGYTLPLIAVNTDGSSNWTVKPIQGLPNISSGFFYSGSCTGNSSTAVCTAAGTGGAPNISFIPLLAVSTNGGINWAIPFIPNLPKGGRFTSTSCTGNAPAICTAAGSIESASYPLLAVSMNGGMSWELKSIAGVSGNGYFQTTSCTGSGSTAICIAAGSNTSNYNSLFAASTNGGETWAMQVIPGLSGFRQFVASSCTGSGTSAICAATGIAVDNQTPLLVVSTDGARSWSLKSVAGLPSVPNNNFNAVSCTGSGSEAICVAAGMSWVRTPLLAVSSDGGTTWGAKSIPNLEYGKFVAASCTGSGATAVCTAAGEGNSNYSPLLVVSRDGGKDWTIPSIPGLPNSSSFSTTQCTGSGSAAICTAAGTTMGRPLVVASHDGGITWAVQTVNGLQLGSFSGSAASSTSSNAY